MASDYHEEVKIRTTRLLRQRLKELPVFINDFFRGIADTTSVRTRIGYAYDLHIFFRFLVTECPEFSQKPVSGLTREDLAKVSADHIEEFMEYLSYYIVNNDESEYTEYQNEERGKSRKLSALRSMLSYFYKKRVLGANPSELVDFPKIHEKNIIRLEVDEIAKLLDEVESGEHLTQTQKKYHIFTKARDLALVTLLLGTGMRVSECVGIDLRHLDFGINGVQVTRKGGNQSVLYFGDEVKDALVSYIKERKAIQGMIKESDEDALFLSMQNRRITVRSVQLLVKKYSRLVTSLKKISPHKLRSTFGTQLYKETGDIYLVADVLGHADVNTTRKHYAQLEDERRRMAAGQVKLRKSD